MAQSVHWLAARHLFAVFRPSFFVFAILSFADFILGEKAQHRLWLRASASLSAVPTFLLVKLYLEHRDREHRARIAGAKLPIVVPYKWPGGMDLIVRMFKSGPKYPGEGLYSFLGRGTVKACQLYMLFETRIITAEPAHIKSILATDFEAFEKGEVATSMLDSVLGTGVFNTDGETWKFHRSMSRPFFNRDRISHFEIFNRHVDDILSQAKRRLREGYALDFQDMISWFTLDSATEFLFGHDVKSLSAGLPYPPTPGAPVESLDSQHPANVFIRAFTQVQSEAAIRVRYGDLWPFFELSGDRTKESMKIINAFIEPIISDAIGKAKMEKLSDIGSIEDESDSSADTLLGHLVRLTDDRKLIKDEILNIAIAGRDTTACLLTFATYMLSQHPAVMDCLYEEIQTQLPDGRRPTFDDIKNMRYMRAVLNETLRLYPPVPFNMRTATRDVVWQATNSNDQPLFVPKGSTCVFAPFVLHRREDLWGPDALVFDPDRFLDERLHKYLVPNPFIFSAFSAGPRICLGQQFAYHEASFMLVRLIQEFSNIELAPDARPPEANPPPEWAAGPGRKAIERINIRTHFTLYAAGGLWVRMEERKRDE